MLEAFGVLEMNEELLVLDNVKKYFVTGSFGSRRVVKAVDGVSLNVRRGETLGLVGESGSGKSTLGRVALRIYKPTEGKVIFSGVDITDLPERKLRPLRRKMQLIPQDPYASFNPVQTIGSAVAEPLIVHKIVSSEREARDKVLAILEQVGLIPPEDFYDRRPYNLSGGQLQRAAIARAMILEPVFVVADEPTSSLDVSIRANILNLLKEFKEKLGQGLIFITHDLTLASLVADTLAVMYLGKIVEYGPAEKVIKKPMHPYTAALINAVPKIRASLTNLPKVELKGEIPDPSKPPKACRLHPRCPFAKEICRREEPKLIEVEKNHFVACHNPIKYDH